MGEPREELPSDGGWYEKVTQGYGGVHEPSLEERQAMALERALEGLDGRLGHQEHTIEPATQTQEYAREDDFEIGR